MPIMLFWLPLAFIACIDLTVAGADEAPKPASLERTDAFEKAYGASFYEFDACGDGLAGRSYRRALEEKFAQMFIFPGGAGALSASSHGATAQIKPGAG